MPTARFVVVSAPLEERVAASLISQLQEAVSKAIRLKSDVNTTFHRDDFNEKASGALSHVIRPGGLPFMIFLLLIAVLSLRELLLRLETMRILNYHKLHSGTPVQPPTDDKHED